MSTYESGFAWGEHDAFHDRREGVRREQQEHQTLGWWAGYWDAYHPRSATWGALQRTPVEEPALEWAD